MKVAVTDLFESRLENVQVAIVDVPPVASQPAQLTVEPVPAVAVTVIELPWFSAALVSVPVGGYV